MLDATEEVFLDDASVMPRLAVDVPKKKLPWPFPGGFEKQNAYNNYQQPTDAYVHAALDLLQEPGTPVKAVADGTVALVATNYPDWTTHHFFIVEPKADAGEGWCYVHVDPATYTFEVGDKVKKGEVLGEVVEFSLGDRDGVDHLHLHYVAFEQAADGKVEMHGLYDPLLRFDWEDKRPPTVHALWFMRSGTLEPFTAAPEEDGDAPPTLAGRVDVLAAISDAAFDGHISAWGVPVVTLEITSAQAKPWRKLVLDQRGPLTDERQVSALYVRYAERAPLLADLPRSPVPFVLRVTATDGDGVIEDGDRNFRWDTAARGDDGKPRFPDGEFELVVRAWDLAGNLGEARATVRVANGK